MFPERVKKALQLKIDSKINKINKTKDKRKSYALSSSTGFAAASTTSPFAARFATPPSFVAGIYAPPVKVKLHFPHCQMPTLLRLTFTKPH
jgi:hypothetical protein